MYLTELEQRIHNFRMLIPTFQEGGVGCCLRGLGEELGELAEVAFVNGQYSDEFYKEAADIAFVLTGMLAIQNQSLEFWLRKKLESAELRIPEIIAKQEARRRGKRLSVCSHPLGEDCHCP